MYKIGFKDFKVFESMVSYPYHHLMIALLWWIKGKYGDLIITCGKRPGDTGVHGTDPCRGVDIRSWIYPDPQAVVDRINEVWVYDPARPEKKVAILHDAGSGDHIHLQVHPNTTKGVA